MNIDYKILDLTEKFKKNIYEYFINSYEAGITPNPCVKCNKEIKFGELIEYAKANGYDKIATGHYVKIEDNFFYMAEDLSKDQTYFLAQVKKENLKYIMFPLANRVKSEIKNEIEKIDIIKNIAIQKESSEICFVPDKYIDLLNT